MTQENIIKQIKENATLKEILKDSFGGIMYNVANKDKYNKVECQKLLNLYNSIDYKESLGGIIEGVFDFIKEEVL